MPDLTDAEIVAACARAMGYFVHRSAQLPMHVNTTPNELDSSTFWYNPLTDRAQALELVEKLRLGIQCCDGFRVDLCCSTNIKTTTEATDDNLLRAICLCAARVQIEKEKNGA